MTVLKCTSSPCELAVPRRPGKMMRPWVIYGFCRIDKCRVAMVGGFLLSRFLYSDPSQCLCNPGGSMSTLHCKENWPGHQYHQLHMVRVKPKWASHQHDKLLHLQAICDKPNGQARFILSWHPHQWLLRVLCAQHVYIFHAADLVGHQGGYWWLCRPRVAWNACIHNGTGKCYNQ